MLVVGDCRSTLARWAQEGVRVQCVVTSPPYWGLRDYGVAPLVWGGDAACAHAWSEEGHSAQRLRNGEGSDTAKQAVPVTLHPSTGATCLRCAAWRGSLGLEPTPELYVAHLVEVFRGVRDVLADDGTLWLNLGDSYTANGKSGDTRGGFNARYFGAGNPGKQAEAVDHLPSRSMPPGLKPKDLCGIPWRVAFALQADGWYLRSDIIWSKPNPMPESVTDRPTKAHEYLFLLSKQERYYYDAESIKEPSAYSWNSSTGFSAVGQAARGRAVGHRNGEGAHRDADMTGRNKRSVWTIATQPYAAAHFATMPPDLVTPCILAGSRVGDTVLDPFMGAGTVAMVAQDLGRRWRGCELNEAYAALIEARTRQQGLALVETA